MNITLTFLDSLTIALHSEFGNDYKLYVEEVEQNVSKPCFSVGFLNPMVTASNLVRSVQTLPVVIHYFTAKENTFDAKKDCYDVAERLWQALEYLPVSDTTVRGYNISWEIVDGVLEFFITYRTPIWKEQELIYMEDGELNDVPIPKF